MTTDARTYARACRWIYTVRAVIRIRLPAVLAVCICTNGMHMHMHVHMQDARPPHVHTAIEKRLLCGA